MRTNKKKRSFVGEPEDIEKQGKRTRRDMPLANGVMLNIAVQPMDPLPIDRHGRGPGIAALRRLR